MKKTNRDRIGEGLEILNKGLRPFVERELKDAIGDNWEETICFQSFGGKNVNLNDPHTTLKIMWDQWNTVFKNKLSRQARSIVSELLDDRNRWAHMEDFSTSDTHRTLDSICRLLAAVCAPESGDLKKLTTEILHVLIEERTERPRLVNEDWGEGDPEEEEEWAEAHQFSVLFESGMFKIIFAIFDWLGPLVQEIQNGNLTEQRQRVLFKALYMILLDDTALFEKFPLFKGKNFKEFYEVMNPAVLLEWWEKMLDLTKCRIDWDERKVSRKAEYAIFSLCEELKEKGDEGSETGE